MVFLVVRTGPNGRDRQPFVDCNLLTDGRSFAPTTNQCSKWTARSEGRGTDASVTTSGGTYRGVEARRVREAVLPGGYHDPYNLRRWSNTLGGLPVD